MTFLDIFKLREFSSPIYLVFAILTLWVIHVFLIIYYFL